MKQILCYGDSNTHGFRTADRGRYDYTIRWTGLVNEALGERAVVFNCGYNGRTCNFEDPIKPYRNGLKFLDYELRKNKPLDVVVLMLGSNDCKHIFHSNAEEITMNMEKLIHTVKKFTIHQGKVPHILLVSPVPTSSATMKNEISFELAEHYKALAKKEHIAFADAAQWGVELDTDGLHFTAKGHKAFAEGILPELEALL